MASLPTADLGSAAIGDPGKVVGLTASVAVRIQHHPSRGSLPARLREQLEGFADVEVVPDPEPERAGDAWRAHRACLEALPAEASHLLVIQDDALPVANFCAKLCAAIEAEPETILCAFVPGFNYMVAAMRKAQAARVPLWPLHVGAFVPLVATVYPREVVSGLLDWVDRRSSARQQLQIRGADDGVVAMYCRTHRLHPLMLVPSICEHDETVPSIGKEHRRVGPHRRAALLDTS